MKSYSIFLSLFALLILSSCSGGGLSSVIGGGGSDLPEERTRGEGLEASFSIQQGTERNFYEYDLDLENSGKFPIHIEQEEVDIFLTTNPRGSDGRSYFTEESTNELYEQVLEVTEEGMRNTIDPQTIDGVLVLKEDILQNPNNKDFSYELSLSYDYRTEFSNNIIIDLDEKEVLLSDSLTQAAPVKIRDIRLRPLPDDEYIVEYHIENRGEGKEVTLENAEFRLGTQRLICDAFRADERGLKLPLGSTDPKLNQNTKIIVYSCPLGLDDFDENTQTQTTTGGSLDYRYTLEFEGNLNIQPKAGVLIS